MALPHTAAQKIHQLSDQARVWIYKSAQPFTAEQAATAGRRCLAFAADWMAHGAPLCAAAEVMADRFVVLAVDERQALASGCSIDSSLRFIQQLEAELGLSLTDRLVVVHERDGALHSCRADEVESLLKQGLLTPDTLVYDDLVTTVGDLKARFRVPLRHTWMARWC
jgi:hypothetical protein